MFIQSSTDKHFSGKSTVTSRATYAGFFFSPHLIQVERSVLGKYRAEDCNAKSSSLQSNRLCVSRQYIQQNIRSDCANIDKILEPPEGQDEGVWKYEHLRYAELCELSQGSVMTFCPHINRTVEMDLAVCPDFVVCYRQFCLELNGLAVKLQVK